MKKLMILVALSCFAIANAASAATHKVSFNGAFDTDWQMSGYLTFDDTGLDKTGTNFAPSSDFSSELDIWVTNPLSPASPVQFTPATATLYGIFYDGSGNLKKLEIGGNEFGAPGSVGIANGPNFYLTLKFEPSLDVSGAFIEAPGSTLKWANNFTFDIEEVNVSAVPLPAAAWMFIAGLAALFGGKWRLKRKVGLKVGLAA